MLQWYLELFAVYFIQRRAKGSGSSKYVIYLGINSNNVIYLKL